MFERLYQWILKIAGHRHALWALAAVSFIESSVFPIPPDLLLIPMILAAPRRAFLLAGVCTVSSVAGGYLGYAIGYFAFETVGQRVLEFYHAMHSYETLQASFAKWGVWIIILKGMTPIPYKLITIASGALKFDLVAFTFASLVSRSLRFFLIAVLLWRFGEPIRAFIERRLMLLTTLFAIALVGGFVVLRYF
ncbi:MAG TPA: YqaA family protein [Alphaproteobacteria bacterium]|nr:YqaA family protein [Alphaproteobacteria bacterium]